MQKDKMNKSLTVTIENIPENILNHMWERAGFRFNEAGLDDVAKTENMTIDANIVRNKYPWQWPVLMADIFTAYAMTVHENEKQNKNE